MRGRRLRVHRARPLRRRRRRTREPWAPNRHKIADLLDALAAIVHLPETVTQPSWLEGDHDGRDRRLRQRPARRRRRGAAPPRPRSSSTRPRVPFAYEPGRRRPPALARVPGRALAGGPRLDRRAAGVVRLRRSRAGSTCTRSSCSSARRAPARASIARILSALVGRENVAGPTLSCLTGDFGLAPLLGKTLAVISDARLNGRGARWSSSGCSRSPARTR